MKQGLTEGVNDFLSRLVKMASMKNVPKKVLLSVPMNGLRHDLKTYVTTQNPKTMEHFRQIAILAEKAQPSQVSTIETYENLLQEIQQIKAKIESQTEQVQIIRAMTEHPNQLKINTRRPLDSYEAMP